MAEEYVTVEWVKDRVAFIEKHKGDPEAAHQMEDDLHVEVLRAIAEGAPNAAELAAAAVKSQSINFTRWYS